MESELEPAQEPASFEIISKVSRSLEFTRALLRRSLRAVEESEVLLRKIDDNALVGALAPHKGRDRMLG